MTRRKQKQLRPRLSKAVIKRLNKIAEEAENIEKKVYIDPTLYKVIAITTPTYDEGFFAVLTPLRNAYAVGPSSHWDDEEAALTGFNFFSGREHIIRIPVKPDSVKLGEIVRIIVEPAAATDVSFSLEKETAQGT
jgi:hypothetical protein